MKADVQRFTGFLPAFLLALLLLGLVPLGAEGQVRVTTSVVQESYHFPDDGEVGLRSLSLQSIPVRGLVGLGANSSIGFRATWAQGRLTLPGGDHIRLSGPTDTDVALAWRRPGNTTIQLQALAVLPTGSASQTAEEALLAGALATDLLPFRISNWGNGGGGGGLVSVDQVIGDRMVAGVAVGYTAGRAFEPSVEEEFSYRPGDHLRVRGAASWTLDGGRRLQMTVTTDRFSEDTVDDFNLYRAGNRWSGVGSYSFPVGAGGSGVLYGALFHRSAGTALLEAAPAMSSQLLAVAGGGARFRRSWGVLAPSFDARIQRSADGIGQGWLPGVGLAGEVPWGRALVVPGARLRYGRLVVREDVQSDVVGLEVSLTVQPR